MNLTVLHRRLLRDVLEIGNAFPLVLTGGYAVQAHRIVGRFSRDIDMAADSAVTMDVIGTKVRALAGRGLPRDLIDISCRFPPSDDLNRRLYGGAYSGDDDEGDEDEGPG
jgi:predicted nucleotidyltransferase component of viral defense system